MMHMTAARQQLGKHVSKVTLSTTEESLKAGIAEAEANLLGNGTQTPVSAGTNVNEGIPLTTNKMAEDN
jgi:hypothetical protein